jgi:hypothetical protein
MNNPKKILSILALCMIAGAMNSQDQLFKKDNTKLLVKILEVGPYEVKYKMHENPDGPVVVESRENVALVIYENGRHETITAPVLQVYHANEGIFVDQMSKADSAQFYRYSNNISVNFFNFFNNEFGLLYQKDFYAGHWTLVIPFAVGIAKPNVTQSTYFGNGTNAGNYELNHKIYEIGAGINYIPSYRGSVNYYIGPVLRYIKYDGSQIVSVSHTGAPYYTNIIVRNNTSLSRYALSITNGFILRTRSRLNVNTFISLGFKSDSYDSPYKDPVTGSTINNIRNPASLYFWSGVNVGYSF